MCLQLQGHWRHLDDVLCRPALSDKSIKSSACISCDGYGGCAWLLGVIYVELLPFFQGTLNAKGPQDLPFSCTKKEKEKTIILIFWVCR
jgi:hypothetical protein